MNTLNRKRSSLGIFILLGVAMLGCSSLPSPAHKQFTFPKDRAFFGDVKTPYQSLGLVRAKVNYESLDPIHDTDERRLCQTYFNKAVRELVKTARDKNGDAVIDVKSVVFLENGEQQYFSKAECADDGLEGQVLVQGIAVKWKKLE